MRNKDFYENHKGFYENHQDFYENHKDFYENHEDVYEITCGEISPCCLIIAREADRPHKYCDQPTGCMATQDFYEKPKTVSATVRQYDVIMKIDIVSLPCEMQK